MIKHYPSSAALAQDYIKLNCERKFAKNDWYGNETEEETLEFAAKGNSSLVPAAEELLEEFNTEIVTLQRAIHRAPAGGWPCIPDYLAGLPAPMRRITFEPDSSSPITILSIISSSGGINAEALKRRGTAILALVMALEQIRPISLKAIDIGDGEDTSGETIIITDINTSPLDLATACYCLSSQGFCRNLNYDLTAKLNGFSGQWPKKFIYGNPQLYYRYLLELLQFNPKYTLLIPGAQLSDKLISSPVAWVNEQIARFTEEFEDKEHDYAKV